jgi:tight adherence protein C
MPQEELLKYLPPLVTAILIASIVYLMWPEDTIAERGASMSGGGKRSTSLFIVVFGWLIALLAPFASLLPLGDYRRRLQIKLIQAGSPGGLNVDEFNAARFITALIMFLCGSFIDSEIGLTPVCALGLGTLGLFYPDIWLGGKVTWRKRRIFRDLPDFLDTLRLAVDAGLDLSSALKVAVEKGRKGPLLDEMEKVERDIALGRTRREGFRGFADRMAMSEINAFVLALVQADQLGASIGPILKIQAEVARTKRWQLAEVLVNKLPMKMLGPLIVFIFPASFIILFTPLVIQWFQSGD